MVDVRTYHAPTMQEALDLVRRDLGRDAVILQSREVTRRRWLRRRPVVEVLAGLGVQPEPSEQTGADVTPAFESPRQATGLIDRRDHLSRLDAGIDLNEAQLRTDPPSGATSAPISPPPVPRLLEERFETIEDLLHQFTERSAGKELGTVPSELFHLYTRLIDADVADRHAREIVLELCDRHPLDELTDPLPADQRLAALAESQIRCSGPIKVERGCRRIVALVGPTGVGKTTTIAKLAANFRLRDRVRLGLVTVDTYRVAAVEQLRTYADIIDLPMKVVTSPVEMRRAIEELSDMDLILIDTAGRSPREDLQLQELKALLTEARVDEVHLVLSLTSSPRVIEMAAEKFAAVGVTSLTLTKLDEAVGLGTLLSTARAIDQPFSYFTTGQDVPDDIEVADPGRATRLMFGEDDLFQRRA